MTQPADELEAVRQRATVFASLTNHAFLDDLERSIIERKPASTTDDDCVEPRPAVGAPHKLRSPSPNRTRDMEQLLTSRRVSDIDQQVIEKLLGITGGGSKFRKRSTSQEAPLEETVERVPAPCPVTTWSNDASQLETERITSSTSSIKANDDSPDKSGDATPSMPLIEACYEAKQAEGGANSSGTPCRGLMTPCLILIFSLAMAYLVLVVAYLVHSYLSGNDEEMTQAQQSIHIAAHSNAKMR
ncbi:MAG: hypothetical protein SGPRY_002015 [Prymnesium sp.]